MIDSVAAIVLCCAAVVGWRWASEVRAYRGTPRSCLLAAVVTFASTVGALVFIIRAVL